MATADIGATEVCQFQKDLVKQARCNFLVQHIAFHASFEVISGVCSSNSIRSRFDCWGFSQTKIMKFDFLVGPICIVIRSDRFDTFQFTEKETGSRGSNGFSYGTYGSTIPWYTLEREVLFWTVFVHALVESFEFRVWQFCIKFGSRVQVADQCELFAEFSFVVSTTDIVTTQVCQFQKDRDEQAQCGFLFSQSREMSTADILAMKVRANFKRIATSRRRRCTNRKPCVGAADHLQP